jgi:hypothetical protein
VLTNHIFLVEETHSIAVTTNSFIFTDKVPGSFIVWSGAWLLATALL